MHTCATKMYLYEKQILIYANTQKQDACKYDSNGWLLTLATVAPNL